MKVEESIFIREKKPLLQKLLDMLLERYPYASILATDSRYRSYSVSKMVVSSGGDGILASRGFVVKVHDGNHYAEYSFDDISQENIGRILSQVAEAVSLSESARPEGVSTSSYPLPKEEKTVFFGSTEYETNMEDLGDDRVLDLLSSIVKKALAASDQLLDCYARCEFQKYTKLFLSRDKDMEQNVMWTNGTMFLLAARGDEIKSCYKGFSKLGGAELLSEMEDHVEECVNTTLDLLGSEPMIPGEYDCICSPEVTGMIAHEAFGHGVEMDMFVKKRALAEQYIGECVASELVTMHDGAASLPETATYFFDDEGTMAHDTIVIEKGILKRGISDLQSALALNTDPTGNGRRESYQRKAYTRMTNTWFEGGNSTKEEMISSVAYGFLLENPSSGMEDPKNWGIQCMVNIAREIKDGKLTGRIFSPIVLTGYVPDLLKSISMVSGGVELSGTGFCGKGYKEWVKVSDGGPYIKARIRLG